MTIKVSVIVPVYNVEKYLRQCLDSLVNQTLKEIEIICINDGTKDNSVEIINEYVKKYSNIILINQENQGLGMARNNAMKHAKGDYIAFVDSDDWVDTDMYEVLYNKAIETDADIVECDYRMVFENSTKIKNRTLFGSLHTWKKFPIACGKIFDWKYVKTQVFNGLRCMVWNRLYKRSLIFNNNLTFPKGKGEDYPFSLDAVLSAKSIVHCGKILYNYRIREASISNGGEITTKLDIQFIDLIAQIVEKHGLTKELSKEYNVFKRNYAKENVNSFLETIFSCKTSIVNAKRIKRITLFGITFHLGKAE